MMDLAVLDCYKAGRATIMSGSATVTGTDTGWLAADIKKGDVFITQNFQVYQVASVIDNSTLTLDEVYQGEDCLGQTYRIIPRAAVVLQAELANRLAKIIPAWEQQSKELKEGLAKLEAGLLTIDEGGGAIDSGEITEDSESSGDDGSGVEVNGEEFE